MNAKDAGKLMQAHRKRKGLTQDQVVERSSVPTPQYLSALENGRYDVRNSEHFKSLVSLYGLTSEQVMEVSPDALITVAPEPAPPGQTAAFDPRTLFHPPANRRREKRPLSPNLAEMIEDKQEKYPALKETRWQQHLNQTRFSDGKEPEAEGWFEMFQAMRRNNVEPEEWPDDC